MKLKRAIMISALLFVAIEIAPIATKIVIPEEE